MKNLEEIENRLETIYPKLNEQEKEIIDDTAIMMYNALFDDRYDVYE